MPKCAPDPGEFVEKLSVGYLFSIGPMIRKGNADSGERCGPRAEVGENGASLARGGVPIKVAAGEAPSAELLRDLAKLLHEDFTRQRIDAPSVKTELRTIQPVAPHAA